jgi:hypothetical protein
MRSIVNRVRYNKDTRTIVGENERIGIKELGRL